MKFTTFLAGMSIGAKEVGFIPFLAAFCLTENEPKPIRVILPFRFISSVTISITALKAFWASVLVSPVFSARALHNYFLFIF